MIFFKDLFLSIDHTVFFFFQNLQRPWLDYFLAWPTRLGETKIILGFLTIGFLIFGKKKYSSGIPAAVVAILAAEQG